MTSQPILDWLKDQPTDTFRFLHGLEKEGLRVDASGCISQTDHPRALGAALTHPYVTTDYAEALLEFITPVRDNPEATLSHLADLHQYAFETDTTEEIWPASMPPVLDGEESIRIAEYGSSHIGRLKHVYRHGLWHRYGRIMQVIAGLHFNFSVPENFWPAYQAFRGREGESSIDFRSGSYFSLIRHFRRHSWLLLYLFGASPAVDRSFLRSGSARLGSLAEKTLYLQDATSLRMSDIGYTNAAQQSLKVCFNSLPTYIDSLRQALHTPYPPYEAIGLKKGDQYQQLNTNILQIENEYYSDIRPKRNGREGEKPLAALQREGVEYIEVRCLDLNPYLPLGIDAKQIRFLNWFLFWCLVSDSPYIDDLQCERIEFNKRLTVLYGRNPELELVDRATVRTIRDWGSEVMDEISALVRAAAPEDEAEVLDAIESYREQLFRPETTPAGQMTGELESTQQDFRSLVQSLARQHRSTMTQQPMPEKTRVEMEALVARSLREQADMEAASEGSFDDFLADYMAQ